MILDYAKGARWTIPAPTGPAYLSVGQDYYSPGSQMWYDMGGLGMSGREPVFMRFELTEGFVATGNGTSGYAPQINLGVAFSNETDPLGSPYEANVYVPLVSGCALQVQSGDYPYIRGMTVGTGASSQDQLRAERVGQAVYVPLIYPGELLWDRRKDLNAPSASKVRRRYMAPVIFITYGAADGAPSFSAGSFEAHLTLDYPEVDLILSGGKPTWGAHIESSMKVK